MEQFLEETLDELYFLDPLGNGKPEDSQKLFELCRGHNKKYIGF